MQIAAIIILICYSNVSTFLSLNSYFKQKNVGHALDSALDSSVYLFCAYALLKGMV